MKAARRKKAPDEKRRKQESKGVAAAEGSDDESCRCKEISRKSLPDLLKVVIDDLSLWKKAK